MTSIFHSFQPVDVFSLDRNSVFSLKIQALNADKYHVDTDQWHCQEHFGANIDVCRYCFSVK